MTTAVFAFIALYLIVDLIYITVSRPAYEAGVRKITGGPGFPSLRPAAAILAYGSMAAAWYFLVVPRVDAAVGLSAKIKAAVLYGTVYGLAAYGVFNGTLYSMFEKYPVELVYRDLAWGISWAIVLTCGYAAWTSVRTA